MAEFIADRDVEFKVARMCAPKVRDIAEKVAGQARRTAPAGKKWVSMEDTRVRDTHQAAHLLPEIPGNLRFPVPGQPWDIEHGLSPGTDYLLHPEDTSTGLPLDSVQHVHCRCILGLNPAMLAARVRVEPTRISATGVTVEVTCTHPQVVAAEYGEVYPTGARAEGTHFMSRAAKRVAGTGGLVNIDTSGWTWTRTGNGSQNNHQ